MADKPRRAWEIDIKAGADTYDDLWHIVKSYMEELFIYKQPIESTSGSPSSNAIVTARVDESITHEKYFEKLHEYLDGVDRERLEKIQQKRDEFLANPQMDGHNA